MAIWQKERLWAIKRERDRKTNLTNHKQWPKLLTWAASPWSPPSPCRRSGGEPSSRPVVSNTIMALFLRALKSQGHSQRSGWVGWNAYPAFLERNGNGRSWSVLNDLIFSLNIYDSLILWHFNLKCRNSFPGSVWRLVPGFPPRVSVASLRPWCHLNCMWR